MKWFEHVFWVENKKRQPKELKNLDGVAAPLVYRGLVSSTCSHASLASVSVVVRGLAVGLYEL